MPKSQSCKITEFSRGSRMPKSQTKLSNKQTITFKMLVTSHGQKIDGKCFCKDCNIFLCTPCTVLDEKCFFKDCNEVPSTPCHVIHKQMPSLQNHRILQGSWMPESHTKPSNIQAVTFIILVTINHTWAILRIVFKTRKKKIDGKCFC